MKLNGGKNYRVSCEQCGDGTVTFYVHDLHRGMHFEYPLIWTRLCDNKYVFYQGQFDDEPLFAATPSETNEADVMGWKLIDSLADFILL